MKRMAAARVQTRTRRRPARSRAAAMLAAAHRFAACTLALLASLVTSGAAEAAVRTPPSRPAASVATIPPSSSPVATKKFGAVEYVSTSDVAARLGLKLTWLERGRKLTLTG